MNSPRFASSKFRRPGLVSCLVARPRLFDVLQAGANRRLVLVIGAAGSGKTTLAANWLGLRQDHTDAWLTCDEADRDPARFVSALIESMRRGFAEATLGENASQLLELDGEASPDVIAALIDDLEEHAAGRVLVIDDVHLVGRQSEALLGDFLEYRPSSLQVVVATRSAPNLRLQRMRAQGELVELRDHDLAFSLEETEGFLREVGLSLSQRDVDLVQNRTEGWAAGVQMAALSIRTSVDGASRALPARITGEAVAGYLIEEVLSRQPPEVVDFMLRISVLDELSVAACTAVSDEQAGPLLEHLCASHLFVTASDNAALTYRYHQLIREVLRAELHRRDPRLEAELHKRAARHFLDTDHAGLAARHLLEAGDATTAFAVLNEHLARDVLTHPTTVSALDVDEFRPDMFARIPEILTPLAGALLWHGAFERGAHAVALADECVIDADRQPDLALRAAVVKAQFHAFVGEFDESLRQIEIARSLEQTAGAVDDWIVAVDAASMYCHAHLGEFRAARSIADRLVSGSNSRPLSLVATAGVMSQAAMMEGLLDEAGVLAQRSLTAAADLRFDRHYFAYYAMRTLSQLALEQRDLAVAEDLVEQSLALVKGARPALSFQSQLDRARVWSAKGDLEAALVSLPAARLALKSQQSPLRAEANELEARLRLELGDPTGARAIAGRLPASRRTAVTAMIALAEGNSAAAEIVLADAPAVGPTVRLDVEQQLLRANLALAASKVGAARQVGSALENALRQGFLQTVLDTAPQLVDHVLASPDLYPESGRFVPLISARLDMHNSTQAIRLAPVDALTDAEVKVLGYLAKHLSYAEIAAELHLSLNTVKTHLRRAYMKLGVQSRSSAITRATTLGLL